MPALKNAKHELFAQRWSAGMVEVEAYEKAGYKPDAANANRLTRNDKILTRVRELQALTQKRHDFTVDDMVEEFNENRRLAIEKDQMAAANAASATKAKVLGMVVDKVKDVTDLDNMDVDELAAERSRLDKEIAELREASGLGGPSGTHATKH